MLEVTQSTTFENGSNNILLSLEYLKEEARRENNHTLYEILETACILGKETETIKSYSDKYKYENLDEDLVRTALLLLKFLKSSPETKKNFFKMLENSYS